jgi:hypothetical protein
MAGLVNNPDIEVSAVVVVVVIVNQQEQPAARLCGERTLAADCEWLRNLAIRQTYIADERADAYGRHRIGSGY